MPAKLRLARSHVAEDDAPLRRPGDARQYQLEVLEPPQGAAVQEKDGTIETRRRLVRRRAPHGFQADAEVHVLGTECSERVVDLKSKIWIYNVICK